MSEDELATELANVNSATIGAWERGDALPTLTQAEKLSEKLRIPFAILFMTEPPKIELPIPDLRTVSSKREKPSLEFFDVICDALLRQRWYREFQEQREAETLPFVGSFRVNSNVNAVARDMAKHLGIDDQLRHECTSWQNFFVTFVQRAEQLGVSPIRQIYRCPSLIA